MNPTPEILTLPSQTFIGLEARFISSASKDANNYQIIPALWAQFMPLLRQIATDEPEAYYGLCDHLDSHNLPILHPDELLYLAAARVPTNAPLPEGMKQWTSPAGTFAKFTHRGSIQKINETLRYIYGKWLPESDFESAPAPDFERYDYRFDPTSEDSEVEIFVSIESP